MLSSKLLVILGPTAVGKTSLAVACAKQLDGEIISADSRQVYRDMDIGSGKDLQDYQIDGRKIPYHLIDIKDAGEEYDLFSFQNDFYKAYLEILSREKVPILCGGSGLYLETALQQKRLVAVPENRSLRKQLEEATDKELAERLKRIKTDLHNTTDLNDRERTLRAIEIEEYVQLHPAEKSPLEDYLIFGLKMERSRLRERIKERLDQRLDEGMIEEVEKLLARGISAAKLKYYGLEYRFITAFLLKELTYEEMYANLLQAIRRFAKKQMSWYRRMEKRAYPINWIDAELDEAEKLSMIIDKYGRGD